MILNFIQIFFITLFHTPFLFLNFAQTAYFWWVLNVRTCPLLLELLNVRRLPLLWHSKRRWNRRGRRGNRQWRAVVMKLREMNFCGVFIVWLWLYFVVDKFFLSSICKHAFAVLAAWDAHWNSDGITQPERFTRAGMSVYDTATKWAQMKVESDLKWSDIFLQLTSPWPIPFILLWILPFPFHFLMENSLQL
jgi:hypothetical protein